jgi:hypothetical protein
MRRERRPDSENWISSMTRNALHHAELLGAVADNAPLLSNRLAWRLREWEALTNTSRATVQRQIKNGDLHVVRIGTVRMIPRSEAIRLGMIAA